MINVRTAHVAQLDIPFADGLFFELPRQLPGRINVDDFIFFTIPDDVDQKKYTVVVNTMDTAGTPYRSIGVLDKMVTLPFVHYNDDANVGVIPTYDGSLPAFWARLSRGSTYQIPSVRKRSGTYPMSRLGVLTSGV
jgi:hypothetical protein